MPPHRNEINAITLVCTDMARSVRFYTALGFTTSFGGESAEFTTLDIGENHVNLQYTGTVPRPGWGRVVFFVPSPDAIYQTAVESGFEVLTAPANASWGERFFHVLDPDGHELSFARPLT